MCDIPDDIVITGFSGRLPESSSIHEFRDNLFNGVDMVNDEPRRWPKGLYDLPPRFGKIKDIDLEQFDHQFFSVHQKQAECMDPQMRMLLETTYEAIVDAGFNPQDLRGSRTGVYIGASYSEVEEYWNGSADRANGYPLTGCARAMFANRVSFSFDLKGPSMAVDTASSSSMHAMALAFEDMRNGRCDSAIVAGCGIIMNPIMSLQFKQFGMLSPDGRCSAFDESGRGFVRSDACVSLLLQRASKARRVYASVLNIRTNSDGWTEQGITFPDGNMQNRLIRETYESAGVHPNDVVYVEAHGTGTKAGDPQEVNSITDFFCRPDRETPLLIGSVKSNMGHSESASGTCAIAKVLIAIEAGMIPANLHYNTPNPELYGILDGRLKVIDRNHLWSGGIIGINSFGFGGSNAHIILKSNPKEKPKADYAIEHSIPRMVVVSGRTREAVEVLLAEAEQHRGDEEFLGLLNEVHSRNIPLHYHRGYSVIGHESAADIVREVSESGEENRPIWYVYSGMGSQWAGMAQQLMGIDVFRQSIRKCAEALRSEGIDLIDIITRIDEKMFGDVVNSFVAIAAIQVALTDLLSHMGITASGMVGHSVGELGCAYADGCFTAEQTVLAAFWRGKSIVQTQLVPGAMAAIGLGRKECLNKLPVDVFLACHNSNDSVTVSGPCASVNRFIEDLSSKGVFAKIVESSGIAFHSKYIADAAPKLRAHLERIIPNPKSRSTRWISTSIPEADWDTLMAQHSSADYHVNNLLSPVHFQEVMQRIPKNAICVEIAPSGLLQAILRRSLGDEVTHLSLLKRDHKNQLEFMLSNIGKLYVAGAHPTISKLYPPVFYPVGRGTPMLNSKIGWDHSQRFIVPKMHAESRTAETFVEVNISKDDFAFINGHRIDNRVLFPATGYMTLVWRTFAKTRKTVADKCAVVFDDVVFHRPTVMPNEGSVRFGISFFDGSGQFELCESGLLTVSGRIGVMTTDNEPALNHLPSVDSSTKTLSGNDVYKELRLRGYEYTGKFRGILQSDLLSSTGLLKWDDEWISFMDTMLHFSILSIEHRELYLPTRIRQLTIDAEKHFNLLSTNDHHSMPVFVHKDHNIIQSGGVQIKGLETALAPRRIRTHLDPVLERHSFIPFDHSQWVDDRTSRDHAIAASVQTALENCGGALKIKVIDVVGDRTVDTIMAQHILYIIESEPTLVTDLTICTSGGTGPYVQAVGESGIRVVNKDATRGPMDRNCHLITGYDITQHKEASGILHNLRTSIKDNGFILLEESLTGFNAEKATQLFLDTQLTQVSVYTCSNKQYILLRPKLDVVARRKEVLLVSENSFQWVEQLKRSLATAETDNRYVYMVCMGEPNFGATGFINCIRNEPLCKMARMVFVEDSNIERFSFVQPLFKDQLDKDLLTNVFRDGAWGSYRHLKLETPMKKSTSFAFVNALNKGDLASINWIEGPEDDRNSDQCSVYYAPVNHRDLMLCSAKLDASVPATLSTDENHLGVEFAGRDSNGERVMAMVRCKSLATTCRASDFIWEIPDKWTMEEASTVPYVYSSVFYALVVRGQIRRGESILIHAGTSGIGLAAISVAISYGLTVYTTVRNKFKQVFMKQWFPDLKEVHISPTGDTSFESYVMRRTRGQGVDLVLNVMADDGQQASIRCLATNGRFLELAPIGDKSTPLGMEMFSKNISFHGIHMDNVLMGDQDVMRQIVKLVSHGIRSGAVRPLPTKVFPYDRVEDAFRYKASGKHIGKVVVQIRDENSAFPTPMNISAIRRAYMAKDKSYILVGGLGGFGLELTNWLISRGATKIVLNSRRGVRTGYQTSMIHRWSKQGVRIVIDTNDVTTSSGTESLLAQATALGPVGGIFNLAAVLINEMLENLSADDFMKVCKPKVDATKHLDTVSRRLCPDLDYFVCFSSMSSGRGNVAQSNYGLANAAMERICESRTVSGLPAVAIQFGAIADAGIIVDNYGDHEVLIGGTVPQRMACCLQTMDVFMQQMWPVQSSMVVTEKRKEDAHGVSLVRRVAHIMGVKDLRNVPDQISLADLGMDSLMGAELKPALEQGFNVILSFNEIRQLTFGKLKALETDTESPNHMDAVDTK